jgi:hypothetical protein
MYALKNIKLTSWIMIPNEENELLLMGFQWNSGIILKFLEMPREDFIKLPVGPV